MKSRRFLLAAAITLVVGGVLWYIAAYPRGMLMANIDYARGHFEIQTYGYPAPWYGEYSRLLDERYEVKLNRVAGCVVWPGLRWYANGYNKEMRTHLIEDYGRDIFEECQQIARKASEAKHRGRDEFNAAGAGDDKGLTAGLAKAALFEMKAEAIPPGVLVPQPKHEPIQLISAEEIALGPWRCNLKRKSFVGSTFYPDAPRHKHNYVEGVFDRTPAGKWVARVISSGSGG
jgi:hypothetical protein